MAQATLSGCVASIHLEAALSDSPVDFAGKLPFPQKSESNRLLLISVVYIINIKTE